MYVHSTFVGKHWNVLYILEFYEILTSASAEVVDSI